MIKHLIELFKESNHHFQGQENGEEVILLLRQHSFHILSQAGFVILFALIPIVIWVWFSPIIISQGFASLFWFATSLFYLILWITGFYMGLMYTLNTVIITNRRIIENEQHGFFHRTVSELHIYRVQDVTVHTKGVLETFMGFGNILVQTAASGPEFTFKQMPNPEKVKDEIMRVAAAQQTKIGL